MRILIVDDEPLISDSLAQLLTCLGHRVDVASGPSAALEQLHRLPPDLLMLDWLMPGGGGGRVLDALTDINFPRTRILLMTGSTDEHLPEAATRLPVLYKPFRFSDLKARLAAMKPQIQG